MDSFLRGKYPRRIPNKTTANVYSVYYGFESDGLTAYGEGYNFLLGVSVANLQQIPEGLVGRSFPDEGFKRFTAEGQVPFSVVKKWFEIGFDWRLPTSDWIRKYSYELEIYPTMLVMGQEMKVDLYAATIERKKSE